MSAVHDKKNISSTTNQPNTKTLLQTIIHANRSLEEVSD